MNPSPNAANTPRPTDICGRSPDEACGTRSDGSYLRAETQKAALAAAPEGQTLATDAAVLIPAPEAIEL